MLLHRAMRIFLKAANKKLTCLLRYSHELGILVFSDCYIQMT